MDNRAYKGCFPASPFLTTISTTERWSRVNASSPKASWPTKGPNQSQQRGLLRNQRTDVLSSILNLREYGWDLGEVVSYRVKHRVVCAVVHGIERDLEVDNRICWWQLGLDNRWNKGCVIGCLVKFQRHGREIGQVIGGRVGDGRSRIWV